MIVEHKTYTPQGPVQVYIAPVSSASSTPPGSGPIWVKIASDGYNGQWATDKLRANKGKSCFYMLFGCMKLNVRNSGQHSFTIPSALAPGDYLVRPEIIALHEGSKQGGAQLYMACVQFKVAGSGSKVCHSISCQTFDQELMMKQKLPPGISFPGTYSPTDPGILFNVYDKPMKKYTPPGGPVQML